MKVEIRAYTMEDYDYVNRIINDNFGHDKLKDISSDNAYEYVCICDGIVVGYYVLTRVTNVVRGFDYYLLDYVCVDKDYQGKGIGTAMMKSIIESTNNVKYIQLTCNDKRCVAQHLYQKFAFEKYDTNVFRRETK